jgi:hypothetical protein
MPAHIYYPHFTPFQLVPISLVARIRHSHCLDTGSIPVLGILFAIFCGFSCVCLYPCCWVHKVIKVFFGYTWGYWVIDVGNIPFVMVGESSFCMCVLYFFRLFCLFFCNMLNFAPAYIYNQLFYIPQLDFVAKWSLRMIRNHLSSEARVRISSKSSFFFRRHISFCWSYSWVSTCDRSLVQFWPISMHMAKSYAPLCKYLVCSTCTFFSFFLLKFSTWSISPSTYLYKQLFTTITSCLYGAIGSALGC